MKLGDFKGIFNKRQLLIDSIEHVKEDYYVVHMKAKTPFEWHAGEHGIFKLPGQEVQGKKWRAFSIASVDSEGLITIGIRTGEKISSFKDKLIHMKKGEVVEVRGPFGWFKIRDKETPIVMIASGVGVTPIRALAKSVEDDTSRQIHIIYSSKYHLFGQDLQTIAQNNETIELALTQSREETVSAYITLAKKYGNKALYYISGSQNVIQSVKDRLKEEGIKNNRVINDPFFGY